jgi:hypothetical protein
MVFKQPDISVTLPPLQHTYTSRSLDSTMTSPHTERKRKETESVSSTPGSQEEEKTDPLFREKTIVVDTEKEQMWSIQRCDAFDEDET